MNECPAVLNSKGEKECTDPKCRPCHLQDVAGGNIDPDHCDWCNEAAKDTYELTHE